MSERLEKIKSMRMMGVTIFCDWEAEIDWLIAQAGKKSDDLHPDVRRIRAEKANELLTAENRELRLRISNVKNFIDKEWME